jgi:hypothetical protein
MLVSNDERLKVIIILAALSSEEKIRGKTQTEVGSTAKNG